MALATAVVFVGSHRTVGGTAVRASGESGSYRSPALQPSGTPRTPSTVPPSAPLPKTSPPHDGSPGPLGGPTFGPGDDLRLFTLDRLPFEFDLPSTWGCMHVKDDPLDIKWTCRDDSSDGAGGWIGVNRCASPCGPAEYAAVRGKLPFDAKDWRAVDAVTSYARIEGYQGREHLVRVAMTHAYSSTSAGERDTVAVAQMTGSPDTEPTMRKIVNEIRMRIPD